MDLSGILGALHQGVADNRSAFMGAGAALMSGPMHTAGPAMALAMQRGALVDQARRKAQLEQIEKARLQEMQMRQAQQAGLDPVWAGTSLPGAVMASRLTPKTGSAPTMFDRLKSEMTPEEWKSYIRKQAGIENESPTAGWKPVTVNGETLFSNKDGTEFKRPEDLGIGARPGGGGPAPTAEMRNKAAAAQKVQENLRGALDEHEKLLATNKDAAGSPIPSGGRTALSVSHRNLQMLMKEAYELGAITGPDLGILQSMIPDPVVSITDPTSYGNSYDIEARTKAARQELEKIVARNAASAQGTLGGPTAPAAPTTSGGYIVKRLP